MRKGTAPAEMVRTGKQPLLTSKQRQAMRAAYAVGAARRAAKLAWMKVMRKMDGETKRREDSPLSEHAATGVAASTAMKALVAALKTSQSHSSLLQEGTHAGSADGYTSVREELRLPREQRKPQQQPVAPVAAVPAAAPVVEDDGEDEGSVEPAMDFTATLPSKLTNKKAVKDARKLTREAKMEVQKMQQLESHAVRKASRKVSRMKRRMQKLAKQRMERDEDEQTANIAFAQANLKRAQLRARSEKQRAMKEEQRELLEAQLEARTAMRVATKQQHQVSRYEKKKFQRMTKALKKIVRGGRSKSVEWDAQLFKPKKVVLSQPQYKAFKEKQHKKVLKHTAALQTAQLQLVAARKKRQTQVKHLKAQLVLKRSAKVKRVQQAMKAVEAAKKVLETAVGSQPKQEGLSRYLDTPTK